MSPINMAWDFGRRQTLRWDFDGRWSWEEFQAAIAESQSRGRAANAPINLILNVNLSSHQPVHSVEAVRDMIEADFDGVRLVVLVSKGMLASMMPSILARAFPKLNGRIRSADDLDGARALIAASYAEKS